MSAQASDSNFIAFNISSQNKFQQNQNVQSLSEVSPTGKIWDKHRTNTDKVLHYYAKADRQYMRELEEKNQDLINESEETDEVDGESLYFRWERKLQRFKI